MNPEKKKDFKNRTETVVNSFKSPANSTMKKDEI